MHQCHLRPANAPEPNILVILVQCSIFSNVSIISFSNSKIFFSIIPVDPSSISISPYSIPLYFEMLVVFFPNDLRHTAKNHINLNNLSFLFNRWQGEALLLVLGGDEGHEQGKNNGKILAHYEKKRENIIPMLQGLQREI